MVDGLRLDAQQPATRLDLFGFINNLAYAGKRPVYELMLAGSCRLFEFIGLAFECRQGLSFLITLVPGTGIEPVRTFYGCDGF